jgi:hypothetical protein
MNVVSCCCRHFHSLQLLLSSTPMTNTNKRVTQVAIKQIKQKFKTWKACIDLREVQSLRMTIHPNIVRMLEVIRESDESLYFVFEVREVCVFLFIGDD